MNYKKVISAILLVSDGSIDHTYFQENFSISKDDLLKIFDDINSELNNMNYGFYIKYNENSSDFSTLKDISSELTEFKPPSVLTWLSFTGSITIYLPIAFISNIINYTIS